MSKLAGPQPVRAKVLIIDGSAVACEGLALMLSRQPDLVVCGVTGDASAAVRLVAVEPPDVVVIDPAMVPTGDRLIEYLRTAHPATLILAWSVSPLQRMHADTFVLKELAPKEMLPTIRRLLNGG